MSAGQGRAKSWWIQAKDDFRFAESALKEGFFSQCCFICQQASEKALKSILYKRGAKLVLTHSLFQLCEALGINGDLKRAAGLLDQYYISARYPDALPGGAPSELFSRDQAEGALRNASLFLAAAQSEFQ